jgi:hypothetical protein
MLMEKEYTGCDSLNIRAHQCQWRGAIDCSDAQLQSSIEDQRYQSPWHHDDESVV